MTVGKEHTVQHMEEDDHFRLFSGEKKVCDCHETYEMSFSTWQCGHPHDILNQLWAISTLTSSCDHFG